MVAPSAPRDARSKIPPGPEGSNGIDRCGRRGQPAGLPPFRVSAIPFPRPLRRHQHPLDRVPPALERRAGALSTETPSGSGIPDYSAGARPRACATHARWACDPLGSSPGSRTGAHGRTVRSLPDRSFNSRAYTLGAVPPDTSVTALAASSERRTFMPRLPSDAASRHRLRGSARASRSAPFAWFHR